MVACEFVVCLCIDLVLNVLVPFFLGLCILTYL